MTKKMILLALASSLILVGCSSQMGSNNSSKMPDSTMSTRSSSVLDAEKAKIRAVKEAGLNEKEVSNVIVEEGFNDDGRKIYDVEFFAKGKVYSYEIDADTGDVLEASSELSEAHTEMAITDDKVKEIVLKDMGIQESDVSSLVMTQDTDDMTVVYEVTIIYNNTEYDYVVDAGSGRILEREVDSIN